MPNKAAAAANRSRRKGPRINNLYKSESVSSDISLQPFPSDISYFACFELPPLLDIDLQALESKFYLLSWKFHPDFHQLKSSEEREISTRNSSVLNQAYRTLRDPVKRVEYLIAWMEEQKKSAPPAGDTRPAGDTPPTDLFQDIFEFHELMEEAKREPSNEVVFALQKSKDRFDICLKQASETLSRLSSAWDRIVGAGGSLESGEAKRCLSEMKQSLARQAYLNRILGEFQ